MSTQGEIDRIKQNIDNTYAVLAALGADMPADQNSDNLSTTAGTAKAVLYSEQSLTAAQQAQARSNISAVAELELSQAIAPINTSIRSLTLGIHTDGLVYLFANGSPVGNGVEITPAGDVYGYVDSEKNIVLRSSSGDLPDGSYTAIYEMEDGTEIIIGDLVLDSNVYYSVTNTLTNCTNSNSATQVVEGESYSATITANSGYALSSVVVTMGGTDISSTAVIGGTITIANVTGNIVITAVAEEVSAEPVTVNIPLLKDTSIVLDATGGDRANTAGFCATPHYDVSNIPKPCVIHLAEAQWAYAYATLTGYVRCFFKDKSGNKLVGDYTSPSKMPSGVSMVLNGGKEDDVTVTITSNNIGTVRFSGMYTFGNVDNFSDTVATLTYTPN